MENTKRKKRTIQRTILTYGSFDLLHIGHVRLLQRAKALGNYLIVGVSTDDFNTLKGKTSVIPFKQRVEMVKSLSCVDKVIYETSWEQKYEDVKKYNATLVMGDDWKGKFDGCIYLPRTPNISSTEIRHKLQ